MPAAAHAKDFGVLQGLLAKAYPDARKRPLVIGPDTTGCNHQSPTSSGNLQAMLAQAPEWNITTVHLYSVVPNSNLSTFLGAARGNEMCNRGAAQLAWVRNSSLAGTPLWNGEGGASYLVTGAGGYLHQFGGALNLLNNLGCLPAVGVSRLLKHDLFENMFAKGLPSGPTLNAPLAPFWSAFAFRQLIGGATVLSTTVEGADAASLKAYAFQQIQGSAGGGSALLLINLDDSLQASVPVPEQMQKSCKSVTWFHLTAVGTAAANGDAILNAPGVALNGVELAMTADGELPQLNGVTATCKQPLVFGPLSAMFAVVHDQGDAATPPPASSTALHVDSALGSDANDGSRARPFKTIQRCHDEASGTEAACEVLPGLYRESVELLSGVTIRGSGGDGVVVSGLEPLRGLKWAKTEDKCVFRAAVDEELPPIPQLFHAGEMMVEARWPNIELGNIGNSSMAKTAWREVQNGSAYGKIVDPELRVPFSWVGGLATLQVGHQWDTWTRRVSAHDAVEGTFSYPQDLPGLAGYDPHLDPAMERVFNGCEVQHAKCNQYWLSGKREALDAPGEWFHEPGALFFYPPTCTEPGDGSVEYKARDYSFHQPSGSDVHLSGMSLKGATVRLDNCTRCSLRNLTLSFPTYDREIRETHNATGAATGAVAKTLIAGQHMALRDIALSQSNNNGITLSGYNVSLENALISYTDWLGTLSYQPLGVTGNQMQVTRCTVRDFGNAGVVAHLPNTLPAGLNATQPPPEPMAGRRLEISYTHIFNGARVGEDTAALYSGGWAAAGQEWHHK